MKSTSEQQNTETRAKSDDKLSLACLANSSNRKGKKSFKEGKYTISIIDDIEFYQARKCLEARSKRLKKKKGKGNKSNPTEALTDDKVKILYELHLH